MCGTLKIGLFICYNIWAKYFSPRSIFIGMKWKNFFFIFFKFFFSFDLENQICGYFHHICNRRLNRRGYSEFQINRRFFVLLDFESGCRISKFDMANPLLWTKNANQLDLNKNGYFWLFWSSNFKTKVQISKIQMVDPIWRTKMQNYNPKRTRDNSYLNWFDLYIFDPAYWICHFELWNSSFKFEIKGNQRFKGSKKIPFPQDMLFYRSVICQLVSSKVIGQSWWIVSYAWY